MESHIDVRMLVHYTMGLTELYCTSIHFGSVHNTEIQMQLQRDFIVMVCVCAWTDHFP